MSSELEQQLFERWPNWFRYRNNPMVSSMSFGFQCGDGWYRLVTRMLEQFEPFVTDLPPGAFQVLGVKQKMGMLRVAVTDRADEIGEIIERFQAESLLTCEVCGEPGRLTQNSDGWWQTLCGGCCDDSLWHKQL